METINKSPQELAVQIAESYPFYSSSDMPMGDSSKFEAQSNEYKSKIKEIEPFSLSDGELTGVLDEMLTKAESSGSINPAKGQGSEGRLQYAAEKYKGYGYNDEEAKNEATKSLYRNSYAKAVRYYREDKENLFKNPIKNFIEGNPINLEEEKEQIDRLAEQMIDISTITTEEQIRISKDFPSGNYLYHGTGAEQLIKILDSGELVSASILSEREDQAAKETGRDRKFVFNNSGYEGISWSMNGIDALPGDRYHMAGFVTAPETTLDDKMQLAVPSRPAPNEVIQIPASIDAADYYDAKTQFELYKDAGLGEVNSVFGNLVAINIWSDKDIRKFVNEPLLYAARNGILSKPGFEEQLRKMYSVDENNNIRLNPDLLQQTDKEIPTAAVWLQAAADTKRLVGTAFEDKDIATIIDSLDKDSVHNLMRIAQQDWLPYEEKLDSISDSAEGVSVPVEKMYFVAPRKDAKHWLKVIARSAHKPAGIMLYDDKQIRLENFATSHRGNHSELSEELTSVIVPKDGYIDYGKVLGSEFTDDMRTGSKHHVIAERHLVNRQNITKIDGELVLGA